MYRLFRSLRRLLLIYLVVSGVLFHAALLVGFWGVLSYFQLTPAQFVDKAMEKSGIEVVWLQRLLHPTVQFEDVEMGGKIRDTHPRIILPQMADWDGDGTHSLILQREALYRELGVVRYDPCRGGGIMGQASCWLAHGGAEREAVLLSAIEHFETQTPNVSGNYGDGWQLAFAYDIASLSPKLSAQARSRAEARIAAAVEDYLLLLDGDDASLWHGRTSLAAMAWLSAVVLNSEREDYRSLQRRAHGHLFVIVEAIELTEAWPEGYNYWVNSRAFITVLALGAYLNGVVNAEHRDRVVALLERIGQWHLYATRPDNRVEGIRHPLLVQ